MVACSASQVNRSESKSLAQHCVVACSAGASKQVEVNVGAAVVVG